MKIHEPRLFQKKKDSVKEKQKSTAPESKKSDKKREEDESSKKIVKKPEDGWVSLQLFSSLISVFPVPVFSHGNPTNFSDPALYADFKTAELASEMATAILRV